MEIVRTIREMQEAAEEIRRAGKRIGVVPTMGFLHQGHTSLIKIARGQSDVVVTTIFVNPAQFGPNEDFEQYPRDLPRDESLAREAGTDVLFCPDPREMYGEGFQTYVVTEPAAGILEGRIRPGHFRGVTTVVAKLFNIVRPRLAVFGQKDAQQLFIIRTMVRDLNFDIEIAVGPIVREEDGLAMSSRNVYLSPVERKNSSSLYRALKQAEGMVAMGERLTASVRQAMEGTLRVAHPDQIDYIAFVSPDTFGEVERIETPGVLVALAVRFGKTRLIDNLIIPVS